MSVVDPVTSFTDQIVTQIDGMDDRIIEIHRMLSEIHAVLAPLLPVVQSMMAGDAPSLLPVPGMGFSPAAAAALLARR